MEYFVTTLIPRLEKKFKRAQIATISDLKIVDFHLKSLKIGDFHGNKDNFGTDLGPKTSRIPEHRIWGVIRPQDT